MSFCVDLIYNDYPVEYRGRKPTMSKRISLVSDNKFIVEMLKLALVLEGYEVQISPVGAYCLPRLGQLPHLIILDVFLQVEDAQVMCQQLKSLEHTRHIPVILLSAHLNRQQALTEFQADDFVSKPFHLHELLERIQKYV